MTVLKFWKAGLTSLAVVAVIAGTTYGLLTGLGVNFGRGGAAQDEPGQQVSKHLAPNRDRLAICVDSNGFGPDAATLEESAKSSVELALIEFTKHPSWAIFSATEPPPIVEVGCGVEPAVYHPDPFFDANSPRTFFETRGRRVSVASYYRVFVFILPPEEVSRLLGDPPFRLTAEESLCSGDSCAQVTTGLYLSPEEIGDVPLITDSLEKAVALEPPF